MRGPTGDDAAVFTRGTMASWQPQHVRECCTVYSQCFQGPECQSISLLVLVVSSIFAVVYMFLSTVVICYHTYQGYQFPHRHPSSQIHHTQAGSVLVLALREVWLCGHKAIEAACQTHSVRKQGIHAVACNRRRLWCIRTAQLSTAKPASTAACRYDVVCAIKSYKIEVGEKGRHSLVIQSCAA